VTNVLTDGGTRDGGGGRCDPASRHEVHVDNNEDCCPVNGSQPTGHDVKEPAEKR
jgi:hypothetical protein